MEWLAAFRHPSMLALLVVPAALLLWTWKRAGRAVVLPLDDSKIQHSRMAQFFLRCAESLPALALAVVIVILAGPQRWDVPRSKRALTNIEFCVDVSGSMGMRFGDGTCYDAAMAAIEGFLGAREGDAFGLTFFGSSVLHWVPLTTDTSAVRCAIPFMRPDRVPLWFGGTLIGQALLAAADVLDRRPEGDRAIVLVSDGESADLDAGNVARVVATLRAKRIALWTIHVGPGEIPAEVVDVAAGTGGAAFSAADPGMLREVFARIDALQPTRMVSIAAETIDDFAPWSAAGLALLAVATLCSLGVRYTPW